MAAMRTTLVLFAIVALAAAVPVANTNVGKFDHFDMGRRSFSSGFSSGYASSSGYSSGSPTPSPTSSGSTTIKQTVTMDLGVTAAQFAGSAAQSFANFGYGKEIGIVDSSTTGTSYKTGCSVSSTASRRASISVVFTAIVSPSLAAAATTAAQAMTPAALQATMATVLTNLKASNNAMYGSLTNPTVSAITAPTVTGGSTSGASSVATFSSVAFAVAAIAAFRR